MRKYNEGAPLGSIIQEMLEMYGLKRGFSESAIKMHWEQLFGPSVARATKSIRLENGILKVAFHSAVIKHEFNLHKDTIRQKLNNRIGFDAVQGVDIF
jgi:hypothetical protein